ncbi:MAG: SAM-dependent chlorinase/fluorinase, partial [Candidatus Omnitrophica bacterium]|nr:SAM-dependent chlorinase/fluorinase [Candidatus Omnitrophota bacterium]
APDNGVLSYVLQKERSVVIREITNKKYFLQKLSNTFHGRDVFAPVAVHLCRDTACRVPTVYKQLGTVCKTPLLLPLCVPSKTKNTIKGTMIHIDHFGNIITNITAKEVRGWRSVITTIKNKEIHGLSSSYASVAKGKLLVIEGSTGFFEIARREGSAAHFLKVQKGTKIMMRRTDNV